MTFSSDFIETNSLPTKVQLRDALTGDIDRATLSEDGTDFLQTIVDLLHLHAILDSIDLYISYQDPATTDHYKTQLDRLYPTRYTNTDTYSRTDYQCSHATFDMINNTTWA